MRFSQTIYRLLLRLYPRDFREEYGDQMLLDFRDYAHERPFAAWVVAGRDALLNAPGEHARLLAQDLRYTLRTWKRAPTLPAFALLTLMLGIGAVTAAFSLVRGVILKPLPYLEPGRLVRIFESSEERGYPQFSASVPNFLSWRERVRSLDLAAYSGMSFTVTGEGEPERLEALACTSSFAPLLGVRMTLGRWFTPLEEQEGHHRVIVLSDAFWRSRFGGAQSALGRSMTLNGASYTIVGVAPPGFRFTTEPGLWTSKILDPGEDRGNHYITVIGRLRPGVSIGQARAEMEAIALDLERQFPKSNKTWTTHISPLDEWMVDRRVRSSLVMLLGATFLVLLIGCANVANLLLARAAARESEFAIRTALGAGAVRLARQLLTESALLSLAGGLLGVAASWWIMQASRSWLADFVPRAEELALDKTVLAFALGVALLTGLAFGMAPAWYVFGRRLAGSLQQAGRSLSSASHSLLRRGLVVAQISLAVVLLIGAALLLQSFSRLQQVPLGFDADTLVTARVALPRAKYLGPRFGQAAVAIAEALRSTPGVLSASGATGIPFSPIGDSSMSSGADFNDTRSRWVEPKYFETMSIPLIKGRHFSSTDGPESGLKVILSEEMARRLFREENPIGRTLRVDTGAQFEVVGVVGDVRLRQLSEPPQRIAYFPTTQGGSWPNLHLVVRTRLSLTETAEVLRRRIREIDPHLPVFDIAPMRERVQDSSRPAQLQTGLVTGFGLVALTLGALGVYAVVAFLVRSRTREIAVRQALGAPPRRVMALILGEGLRLTFFGIALGLAGAFVTTRVLADQLFGIHPLDAPTFGAVPLVLAVVALVACYFPARRAAAIDPMSALRTE